MASEKSKHRWRFHRAGGTEQVQLETGEDLLALGELDQKLWVALACPVDGLTLDPKTLALVDADKDGRIRAPELLAAIQWAASVLKDTGSLVKGSAKLPLAALNDTDEGKKLAASAKQILRDLGKKGADAITVDDTTDTARIFADTKFNGDGVLPPASADDEDLRKAITEILGLVGGVKDRCGADGIDQPGLDKFFTEADAFSAWWRTAETDAAHVLPLGDATTAAAEAFRAVQPKIDDYFTRVRLAAFDDRASAPLNRDPAEYAALAGKLLTEKLDEIASLPIARVEAKRPLPLTEGLNPAWSAAAAAFATTVVTPLLGDRTELTEAEWATLSSKMAAHEAWRAAKAGSLVEPLGLPRVREMLEKGYKNRIADLIAKDLAVAPQADAIASVDKLVRFHRDLFKLANNFVTFRDFYARKKATFQIGTLYLDGRSCDLCVKVADAGAHSAVALASGACLAYCDLTRKSTDQKMTIVAAFTNGDADNLLVGRNGLFYDREGADWDATIVKLVDNPISVRQAFWTPYKRVAKLIDEQIEKFATSRDKEMQDKAAANVTDTSKAVEAPKEPGKETTPFDVAKFAGIFAAIGLALGMIGSALAAVATGFLSLAWWQMPLALAGVLLLISGPSMLIAYMKLRKRNLAPILDGAGWAVNARARINIPFGASLTQMAHLPEGSERTLSDPYEEKSSPWPKILVIVAILAAGVYFWRTGQLKTWLHDLQTPPAAATSAPSAAPSAAPAK
ncbi:MAG: hypothetical protein U0441_37900 [Polyangiaceae bacterium]